MGTKKWGSAVHHATVAAPRRACGIAPQGSAWQRAASLMALLVLAACGGGSGGGAPASVEVDLGLFSATVPATTNLAQTNPHGATAQVEAVGATGPFDLEDAPALLAVPGGAVVNLPIQFTPTGSGLHQGTLQLRWTAGTQVVEQTLELRATGEPLSWLITPDELLFGDVLSGQIDEVDITFLNQSGASPVTFTSADVPTGFTIVGDPFPIQVDPGLSGMLTVRYEPTETRIYDSLLRLGPDDVGGDLRLVLRANSSGAGEVTHDLGMQTLTAGVTPEVSVDVPADAISVTFEAQGNTNDTITLETLEGPGGKVYENAGGSGPQVFWPARELFAPRIPSTNEAANRLVSGGGTYKVRFRLQSGSSSALQVTARIEARPGANTTEEELPLNVFLAPSLGIPTTSAPSHMPLQNALAQAEAIFQTRGISFGDIDYYAIGDTQFDDVSEAEIPALMRTASAATEPRLNVFLVRSVWNGFLLGYSPSIGGGKVNGVSSGGVVVQFQGLTANQVGEVMAHECCHGLGIWHTTEGNGTYDHITDTPECPVATAGSCGTIGGGQLMFFEAFRGTTLTSGQGFVLRRHVLMNPVGGGAQHKRRIPRVVMPLTEAERNGLAWRWCLCGTR